MVSMEAGAERCGTIAVAPGRIREERPEQRVGEEVGRLQTHPSPKNPHMYQLKQKEEE